MEIESEDHQKYALSISIVNFLKASTLSRGMQGYLKNRNQIFRQILISEELYSSPQVKEVPVDIENTFIGRDMNCLIETISGVHTIQAYSDVSFRVISKMADVLMNRQFCEVYQVDATRDEPIDDLMNFQKRIYKEKKKTELEYWVDVPPRYIEQIEGNEKQFFMDQHYHFTQSNGVALLQMFLTSKFEQNEIMLKTIADPLFDEKNYKREIRRKGLVLEIYEKQSYLEQKFKAKYQNEDDLYSVRRAMFEKQYQQANEEEDVEQNSKDYPTLVRPAKKDCKSTRMYKFMQDMQFEELGFDLKNTMMDSSSASKERESKLKEKQQEEFRKRLADPTGGGLSMKEKRGDGFLNKELRSLTVAAYLRCLYGAIEYAPSNALRNNSIQNIKDPLIFRGITQLCDSTNWDENANIGGKYLRVMRSVIKLPISKDKADNDIMLHYDFMAIVIQKVLFKIMDKMKKDIQFTHSDTISIYEISLTLFAMIQQTNYFVFSNLDIIRVHNAKERMLGRPGQQGKAREDEPAAGASNNVKFNYHLHKVPGSFTDVDEGRGPPRRKCEYVNHRSRQRQAITAEG